MQTTYQASNPKTPINEKATEALKYKSTLYLVKNSHIPESVSKFKNTERKGSHKHILNCSDFSKKRNPFYDNRKLSANKVSVKKHSSKCKYKIHKANEGESSSRKSNDQCIKKQKYYYQSIISAQGVHKGAYKVGYNSLKSTNIPNTFRNMVSKVSKFELRKESNTKNVKEKQSFSNRKRSNEIISNKYTNLAHNFSNLSKNKFVQKANVLINKQKCGERFKKIIQKDKKEDIIKTPTNMLSGEEFKAKLFERNNIHNFFPTEIKERNETSEERLIKNNCTFRPNLKATKQMNLILNSCDQFDDEYLTIQNSYTNPNSVKKKRDFKHHSSANSLIGLSHKLKSRETCVANQKTMILKLNLNSNSSSTSNLFGIVNNGYTQRSIERKGYSKVGLDLHPLSRTSEYQNDLNMSLSHSKSETKLINHSLISCDRLFHKSLKEIVEDKTNELSPKLRINRVGTTNSKYLINRSMSNLNSTKKNEKPKMDVKPGISKYEGAGYYTLNLANQAN